MIYYKAVIDMQNPNALIAMAQVSCDAMNPYAVFCEYIKYCIFTNASDMMTIEDLKYALETEFGLHLPHNIVVRCLTQVNKDGLVSVNLHQISRKGEFDTSAFDNQRRQFRETEQKLISALQSYVLKYGREWSEDFAREMLTRVLDKNNLAYDIFIHDGKANSHSIEDSADFNQDEICVDDEETDKSEVDSQPLHTDDFFVGQFIETVLNRECIERDYLLRVCEGLMVCIGAYQLPSSSANGRFPQISGSEFYFDTRLLLRFLGCAGDSAVAAAKELVELIQKGGGVICYYQQTLEEMQRAFEAAIRNLASGDSPRDYEMRLYTSKHRNAVNVLTAKKASLVQELSKAGIYLRVNESFSEQDHIRFGFDLTDFSQFMCDTLSWDPIVVENDALAIWETHMKRMGNYQDYCGTSNKLPVFVTTNSRLIGVSMQYRDARKMNSAIAGWSRNRLPVITDLRLTCRLWSPAEQGAQISKLYLSANAVAAKRPTTRYYNKIRELATELSRSIPEESGICLSEYFDDTITELILEKTEAKGLELDIGTFASTIEELAETRAKLQEEKTVKAERERDKLSEVNADYAERMQIQQRAIIDDAVEHGKNKLGTIAPFLRIALWWPTIIAVIVAVASALISWFSGNWNIAWAISGSVILEIIHLAVGTDRLPRMVLKWQMPKLESKYDKKIHDMLGSAAIPFELEINKRIKENTKLWKKCVKIVSERD